MNGLGLFAGIGGLELGLHLADRQYRTSCFVEKDKYAQRVLSLRFPDVPIWNDVTTFNPDPWKGGVDIVTAGFPCQPFSTAARGRNRGESMWPDVRRVVSCVLPRFVFLENVPRAPWDEVEKGLKDEGFTVSSRVFCSSESGAPHRRKRKFLLASNSDRDRKPVGTFNEKTPFLPKPPRPGGKVPRSVRVADGFPSRVDRHRLRACGNAVIPEMAANAFLELKENLR